MGADALRKIEWDEAERRRVFEYIFEKFYAAALAKGLGEVYPAYSRDRGRYWKTQIPAWEGDAVSLHYGCTSTDPLSGRVKRMEFSEGMVEGLGDLLRGMKLESMEGDLLDESCVKLVEEHLSSARVVSCALRMLEDGFFCISIELEFFLGGESMKAEMYLGDDCKILYLRGDRFVVSASVDLLSVEHEILNFLKSKTDTYGFDVRDSEFALSACGFEEGFRRSLNESAEELAGASTSKVAGLRSLIRSLVTSLRG